MKIYKSLAELVLARENCIESGNKSWQQRHEEAIYKILKERMPSGSGFDNGTSINLDKSNRNRLVFDTKFHHMDSDGYYTKWTSHTIKVWPDLVTGIFMKVSGRNHNGILDYIYDVFKTTLDKEQENG